MTQALVWDASALHHAIAADRVDVMGDLASPWRNVSTAAVRAELRRNGLNLTADWIEIVHVDELDELRALFSWAQALDAGPRDIGEATVCAWTEIHGGIPLIDDRNAKRTAIANGLDAHGTLWLFVEAVHAGRITLNGASGLVSTLIEHGARYPAKIKAEGFAAWARAQKLV